LRGGGLGINSGETSVIDDSWGRKEKVYLLGGTEGSGDREITPKKQNPKTPAKSQKVFRGGGSRG